jgi:hypothetical protein
MGPGCTGCPGYIGCSVCPGCFQVFRFSTVSWVQRVSGGSRMYRDVEENQVAKGLQGAQGVARPGCPASRLPVVSRVLRVSRLVL